MRFGLDSTGEVSPAAHHAVGSSFALRYLSRYTSKVITAGEYQDYKSHGIDLAVVFEDGAANALNGYNGGRSDAAFARDQARAAGMPPNRPIYFAVDFDPAGGASLIDGYFDGVASILTKQLCGPYGGYEVVNRQFNRGFWWAWQTYAWSGGRWDARAQLRQYSNDHTVGGVGVDFNQALAKDFGQWDIKTVPADPHHYLWFPATTFPWRGHKLSERALVVEYDQLRARHLILPAHRARLRFLEASLRTMADRAYAVAHQGKRTDWITNRRGWRFQQLIKRADGVKLV